MHPVAVQPPRPLRPRVPTPSATDGAIAGGFVLLTLVEVAIRPGGGSPGLTTVAAVLAMVLLAWRRLAPTAVAVAVVTAQGVANPEHQLSIILAVAVVAFTVGAETGPPRSWLGLAVLVIPFTIASVAVGPEPSDAAAGFVFLVAPWGLGVTVRRHLADNDAAVARATEETAERARAAVDAERARIARELHDIVSHSISVVTIQTQAVRRRLGPDHAAEARDLARVEETAREAMVEMRRLLGVLRSDGQAASLAPQPGLQDLERLVTTTRDAGLPVSLEVSGDRDELPPGLDLAAYRVVQEALTNARRHSGAHRVDVRVRVTDGAVAVEVADDGCGIGTRSPDGQGLLGLEERVAVFGGTLEVGPGPRGGTRVAAHLPRETSP